MKPLPHIIPAKWILAGIVAAAFFLTYPGVQGKGWHLGCDTSEPRYITTWLGLQFCRPDPAPAP